MDAGGGHLSDAHQEDYLVTKACSIRVKRSDEFEIRAEGLNILRVDENTFVQNRNGYYVIFIKTPSLGRK